MCSVFCACRSPVPVLSHAGTIPSLFSGRLPPVHLTASLPLRGRQSVVSSSPGRHRETLLPRPGELAGRPRDRRTPNRWCSRIVLSLDRRESDASLTCCRPPSHMLHTNRNRREKRRETHTQQKTQKSESVAASAIESDPLQFMPGKDKNRQEHSFPH